ncbi:hypothetical protein QE152_g5607 [Popillia japonica]|uniref:Uncharacterized protein n=1 Tax=Popillia japonica TaxID=7064 RepID=A0AAW1MHE4_POPJA
MITEIKKQLYEGVQQNRIDRTVYNEYCKTLKMAINRSKKKVYSQQILHSENKNKATWNILKEIQETNSHIRFNFSDLSKEYENNKEISKEYENNKEMLNAMNEYFSYITQIATGAPSRNTNGVNMISNTFILYPTNPVGVYNTILIQKALPP